MKIKQVSKTLICLVDPAERNVKWQQFHPLPVTGVKYITFEGICLSRHSKFGPPNQPNK